MRRVKCYECGKIYNFDVDDFCPKCGAFNQPARTTRVAADGTVVRNDGLNESNHEGSFVHAELHEENKARRRTGLDKDLVRASAPKAKKSKKSGNVKLALSGIIAWMALIMCFRLMFWLMN